MCLRLLILILFAATLTSASLGKSDSCESIEVPVQPLDLTGATHGFTVSDFLATAGKTPLNLKSIMFDDGPRRVVLVVDQDKKLSPDTRKAEQLILQAIFSSARQNDLFAMITARGPERTVQFTGDHAALLRAFSTNDQAGSSIKDGVLDAVLKGVGMFGSAQTGDAIIVIAADLGGRHSISRNSLEKTLLQHQIRLFGIALGPVARNSVSGGTVNTWGNAGTTPSMISGVSVENGDQNFHPLTLATGGIVFGAMNSNSLHADKLKDPSVEPRIKERTNAIFNLVKTYYRMEIETPQQGAWQLGLSEQSRKKAPGVVILYPHELWPCFNERQSSASSR